MSQRLAEDKAVSLIGEYKSTFQLTCHNSVLTGGALVAFILIRNAPAPPQAQLG